MAFYFDTGFDLNVFGDIRVDLAEVGQSVVSTNVANLGTTYLMTRDISAIESGYVDLMTTLEDRFDAVSPTSAKYTVQYLTASNRVRISKDGATDFHLEFPATDAGTRARGVLGFSDDTSNLGPAATTWTGDLAPEFIIVPEMPGFADVSDRYEETDFVSGAIAASGATYSVTHEQAAQRYDLTVTFEPYASVFAGGAPWTWEDFVKHVRGNEPFAVVDTTAGTSTVHRLRPEGAVFDERFRRRRVRDFNDWWDVQLRTYYLGAV